MFRIKRFNYAFALSFLILFALWIVLSGRFDGFHLAMGLIASAFVAAISGDMMFTSPNPKGIFGLWLRLAGYIPCIDDPSGKSLPGKMEEKIAAVFRE